MRTPESWEKNDICKYLDMLGCWYTKPTTRGFGKSGVPDIIACVNGKFVGIEVKREGKQPTRIQELRMHGIESTGGKTFWGTAQKVIAEFETWISTTIPRATS